MPAYTPHLNLYKPGGGSTGTITPDEVADVDRFNANMDIIDGAVDVLDEFRVAQVGRNQQFRGVTANIGSVAGMVRGDTYQETDALFRRWEFDGTNWITSENGMFLVRPSAVTGTGATLDPGGFVALATASGNIDLSGIFSSRFDRYLVDVSIDTAASDNGALFQLIASGTPIAAGYYGVYTEQAIGVGPTKNEINNLSSFAAGRYATNGGALSIEVFRPSKATGVKLFQIRSQDGATYHRDGGGYVVSATAVEGLRLILGAATVTVGKIKVYGFR